MHTKIKQVIFLLVLVLGCIVYANQDQVALNDTSVASSPTATDAADGDADAAIMQSSLQPMRFALLCAGYFLFAFTLVVARGLFKRPLVRAPPSSY